MFNVSLSDRLKAAVNQLEATGTSLQARAQAGLASASQQQPPSSSNFQGITSPTSPVGHRASSSISDLRLSTKSPPPVQEIKRNGSIGSLADGALANLRKGFNSSRQDLSSNAGGSPSLREDANEGRRSDEAGTPQIGVAGPSRPSSPAKTGGNNNIFSLESATPSSSASPPPIRRASPGPSHLRPTQSPSSSPTRRPRSPLLNSQSMLDSANPDDPATYPLPPSPTLSSSLSPTNVMIEGIGDPLGASPMISPAEKLTAPNLEIGPGSSTPDVERAAEEMIQSEEAVNTATETDPKEELVELEELSDSLEVLQSQIRAANKVLKGLTPLSDGVKDPVALEGWVRMVVDKGEIIGKELQNLQGQVALQESRMEELRDTHRLEGSSQIDLITKLRSQLSTAESNLASRVTDLAQLSTLRTDYAKAQTQIKEEEEKRTKAISLLKTVRMKLVKAEKDKEEIERDRAEERAERSRALEEVERVKADREREVTRLRQGFERELQGVKERAEKEMRERKAAWELEMITTKATHAKDLTNKTTMVNGLEAIVKELSATKDQQFHTIQAKQSEAESASSESESLRNRTKELEFQLREANERITLLEDSISITNSSKHLLDVESASITRSPSRPSTPTNGDVQKLLAEAEARNEGKMSDLRFRIRSLEKERNELENEFGSKLQERVYELEKVRRMVQEKESEIEESRRNLNDEREKIKEEIKRREGVEKDMRRLEARFEESKEDTATAQDGERLARDELSSLKLQLQTLNTSHEEQKTLIQKLRDTNKILKEELRKVQSSAQLMEKQRNPGVGYWSASNGRENGGGGTGTPTKEAPPIHGRQSMESHRNGKRPGSPTPSTTSKGNDEEEVNLEYLRNVILQFLENPHMRRQLVQVLSVILHFTPQELRRLNAKISVPT